MHIKTSSDVPGSAFTYWIIPVVQTLRELGGSAKPADVVRFIEQHLDEIERNDPRGPNNYKTFNNDIHWARQYLAWAGYIDASKRGMWRLTQSGQEAKLDEQFIWTVFNAGKDHSKASK